VKAKEGASVIYIYYRVCKYVLGIEKPHKIPVFPYNPFLLPKPV
jgi:hypothetical protein